jgi:predicted anti-sigma-YlaC factor YlaD
MHDPTQHEAADALLPWYATGEIDGHDRAVVETHLADCAQCRQQLALERRLVDEFQAHSPEVECGWARLRGRIEAPSDRRAKIREAWDEFRTLLSRPAIAALATAQVAILIVGGATLHSLSRPAYHALGSAPAPASGNALVMFRADATEQQVADALRSSGASIVEGPTAAGAFLVRVPAERRQGALARLRSAGIVTLAQPIDGSSR